MRYVLQVDTTHPADISDTRYEGLRGIKYHSQAFDLLNWKVGKLGD